MSAPASTPRAVAAASPNRLPVAPGQSPLNAPTTVLGHEPGPKGELWRTLLTFRREFVMVGLYSALANVLMLTPTLYMLQVFDRVMVSQSTTTLLAVSLIALVLFGVMALAEWVRSRLLVQTGVRLDDAISTRVFNASFESHLAGANLPGQGPARAFSDLLQLRQFITGNGIFAFFDLPWVPIYIAVMFLLHPALGWLSIAFALLQAALAWFGHRRTLQPAEVAQLAGLEESQYLQGKLRNAETLEAMGMVANLKPHWARRHEAAMQAASSAQSITHRVTAVSKFVRYTQQSFSRGGRALGDPRRTVPWRDDRSQRADDASLGTHRHDGVGVARRNHRGRGFQAAQPAAQHPP